MPEKPKLRKPPAVDPAMAQAFIEGAPNASKLSSEQASKRVKQQDIKLVSEQPKAYGGFYIDADTMDRLAMARVKLLRLPGARRADVNKSAIVEAALQIALDDFEANGDKSELASKLLTQEPAPQEKA